LKAVRDALIEIDLVEEPIPVRTPRPTLGELAELHAYAEQRALRACRGHQRVLVTAHDAFNYFGRRYGYEVVGIQGSPPSRKPACATSSALWTCSSTADRRGVRRVDRLAPANVEALIAGRTSPRA
jgi:manganese/zinc/iron transport system substrate-binding protein